MTALRTMSIRIVDPQAERLIVDLASQNLIEIDETEVEEEALSAQEEFRRLGVKIDAWRKSQGFTEEDELTMEEIVAICKEARAERYAKKQEQKNTACR